MPCKFHIGDVHLKESVCLVLGGDNAPFEPGLRHSNQSGGYLKGMRPLRPLCQNSCVRVRGSSRW